MNTVLRTAVLVVIALLAASLSACGERPSPDRDYEIVTPDGGPLFLTSMRSPAVLVARDRATHAVRKLDATGGGAKTLRVSGLAPTEDAFFWVAGCRELSLPNPPPSVPGRLEYGPRVRMRLIVEGGIPPAPFVIGVIARWRGPGDAPDALARHGFPHAAPEGWFPRSAWDTADPMIPFTTDKPEVFARFCAPGRYRAQWTLWKVEKIENGTSSSGGAPADAGIPFTVADTPDDQTVELRIDRASLEEAGLPRAK
jgi:hypothetical protein